MRKNKTLSGAEQEIDFVPAVKIFNPCGSATWLLTELDLESEDIAFGLCDLGFGCPELGSASIAELQSIRGRLGIGLERDLYFRPDGKTLMEYAKEAWKVSYIKA